MKSFTDFQLPTPLQQTLKKMNFTTVTEVQDKAMPIALTSGDLVVCAQTGSGKTLAYSLPMLSKLFNDPSKGGLVLAPSRELAKQIADVVRPLVENTKNLRMSVVVGGTDMHKQIRSLKRKPQVIIATPGRLNDHLRRRTVELASFDNLVLDEGDRMLDMGFAPQLEEIFKFMPEKRHTMLFTATLPSKVKNLIKNYMYQPHEIIIGERSKPVSQIKQKVIFTKAQLKEEVLLNEINKREGSIIIFSKTKMKTDKLANYLNEYGLNALRIHGDRTQGQRNRAIEDFRNNKSRILCATDVVARGLDIPHVRHVVNFDLPMMDEDFVHRVGRTARNGATGEALSFVTPSDRQQWKKIEKKYKLTDVEAEGDNDSSRDRDYDSRSSSGKRNSRDSFRSAKGGGRSSQRSGRGRSSDESRDERSARGSDSRKKSMGGKKSASARGGSERSRSDERPKRNDERREGSNERSGRPAKRSASASTQKGGNSRPSSRSNSKAKSSGRAGGGSRSKAGSSGGKRKPSGRR